jgi:hypothetical protein
MVEMRGYFLQTRQGAYNGMFIQNLRPCLQSGPGSSLAFSELHFYTPTLEKYSQQTGREAVDYFNLLHGKEKVLLTPFGSAKNK